MNVVERERLVVVEFGVAVVAVAVPFVRASASIIAFPCWSILLALLVLSSRDLLWVFSILSYEYSHE